jgi:hypothetical protein
MGEVSYADKLTTQLYWWLGRKRPFIINDEYKIELIFIDKINNSAKIQITNLKTGKVISQEPGEIESDVNPG